ncbi:hypothetical protein B7463_g7245, partial [Scytalidium lignicola]
MAGDRASSQSPRREYNEVRRRSRSPRRRDDERGRDREFRDKSRRKEGGGGFKWKEKRRDTAYEQDRGEEKRLERGYRKRSQSPKREKASSSVEDKFGVADKFGQSDKTSDKQPEGAAVLAPKKTPAVTSGEPLIIVYINDRLGTKAAIPCLASDPIKLFKAQVAARIGRQPHEILLKRQGERPFKDQLTLEDYGVSNGVQLDLEIDTGE